jgi:hypothetical protein
MFPMADNKLLIATIDKGLFLYDNKKLLPWENETNSLIKKKVVWAVQSTKLDCIILF